MIELHARRLGALAFVALCGCGSSGSSSSVGTEAFPVVVADPDAGTAGADDAGATNGCENETDTEALCPQPGGDASKTHWVVCHNATLAPSSVCTTYLGGDFSSGGTGYCCSESMPPQ